MGRRKRATVPDGMPVVAEVQGGERERLSLWFKEQIDYIQRESDARIEILRTVGEHPSPIMARFVRLDGQLGLEKSIVARRLGLSVRMLEECYGEDYELGKADVVSSVAANMIRIGQSQTDPAAAKVGMDILSRRGGQEWRPAAQKLEVNDDRNKPPVIDSSALTYEDRQALRAIVTRALEQKTDAEPDDNDATEPVLIE